jgi:LmbE family N-acetylglucosaminyl deacetylase
MLVVLAHPDDESFGMGGTLAHYARQGVGVHLVFATRGEAGDVDPHYLEGFQSIAERRESELRCAAGCLGLAGVYFLEYRDSGMPGSADNAHPQALIAAPLEEVAARVTAYIRRLKPQVVVTFDPIGGYKHPDHIAIHKATVAAFHQAADPAYQDGLPPHRAGRLYYQVIPKRFLRFVVSALRLVGRDPRRFGRNQDIDLASLVEEGDFPTHAQISFRDVLAERDAAAACHASQGGGTFSQGVFGWLRRWIAANEYYMRAYPPPEAGLRESDLFNGL